MPHEEIPCWDGDPASFEAFATSCKWFEYSLKDAEKKLAAPKVWQKLSGVAKSVVKHLEPKDFSSENGMEKLLAVLRESPLQQLPIPDSFSRLEKWSSLKRTAQETIPQLLVREEELFVELQQALQRARHERSRHEVRSMGVGASEHDPPTSPTRSPNVTRAGLGSVREDVTFEDEEPQVTRPMTTSTTSGETAGFFEHELRGYRLLKAAKLSQAERQHVLTLTRNSTHFNQIRQALRSLFADGADQSDDHGRFPRRTAWFAEDSNDWEIEDDWWPSETDWWSEDAYWNDWSPTYWEDDYGIEFEIGEGHQPGEEEGHDPAQEDLEGEKRLEEAYTIAAEANKTLAEAKMAVAKVRAARGYYSPVGMKGGPSGSLGGKGKGKSKSPFGKGKGNGAASLRPCFICGQNGHGYARCPDRWSRGSSSGRTSPTSSPKGPMKGFKGKEKGGKSRKGGKAFWVDYTPEYGYYEVNVMSLAEDTRLGELSLTKAIIDSGATESVSGIRSMSKLIDSGHFLYDITLDNRPRFRFGNGEHQRAVSKCYLLDGGAEDTPLLIGSRILRARRAVISYHGDYLAHRGGDGRWWVSQLWSSPGGHLVIDLSQHKLPIEFLLKRFNTNPTTRWPPDDDAGDDSDPGDEPPPWKKRPRTHEEKRQHDPTGWLLAATTGHARDQPEEPPEPEEMTEERREQHLRAAAFLHSGEVSNYTPSVPGNDEPGLLSEPLGEPKEPEEKGEDVIVRRVPIDLEEEGHEAPEDSERPLETVSSFLSDAAGNDHVEHAVEEHGSHMHGEAHGQVEQHGECQSVIFDGRILMVEEDSNADALSDRLSKLARRLNDLKRTSPTDNEDMSSFHGPGPTPCRVAVHGTPRSWTSANQQVRSLAGLQSLWPETPVHHQGHWHRGQPGHWTSARSCRAGATGTPGSLPSARDHGEDFQWEASGDPRTDPGGDTWTRPHDSSGQGERDLGGSTDGWDIVHSDHGEPKEDAVPQGDLASPPESTEAIDQGGEGSRSDGEERRDHSNPSLGQSDERELKDLLGGGGRQRGGDRADEEGAPGSEGQDRRAGREEGEGGSGIQGRVNALWKALSGLRQRMRSTCPTRLEAELDTNPDNLHLSPTRQQTTAEGEPSLQQHGTTSTTSPTFGGELDDTTSTTSPTLGGEPMGTICTRCPTGSLGPSTARHQEIVKEIAATNHLTEKVVRPSLAKRLALAAAMTVTLMEPVREMINNVSPQVDVMEIACSPESTLTASFQQKGYYGERINFKTGYDLDTRKGTSRLADRIKEVVPRLAWVSFRCTRLSSLQNLTERTPEQWDAFLKRRGRDLSRCDEIARGLEPIISSGNDIAWEWPTSATPGWKSRAIKRLIHAIQRHGRSVYWIRVDGCAYGLEWKGIPLRKAWTILTTSRELWLTLNKRCDRSHEHAECRGQAAEASSYYPVSLCRDVVKGMEHRWRQERDDLTKMVETYLLEVPEGTDEETTSNLLPGESQGGHHGFELEPQVMALSRKRLDLETAPTGKRLEAIKQMMLRVHRASGHPGMSNLVQLLKARGSPGWALELAANLECPECKEASKPKPRPPASLGEIPPIYEHLGTDVFEHEEPTGVKHKLIIWRDRGSGLTMIDHLKRYETGNWEPTTADVIKSMTRWLMTYPSPKWTVADSARYYTSQEFMNFLNRSGVGLTIAPAEAHWLMGFEESAIGLAKRTVERLIKEGSSLDIPELYQMAAAAMNSHIGPSGFSAYQWVFGAGGGVLDEQQLLQGIDPSRAFDKLVKEREKAKIAFERERARERFSKLANAIGRKASQYQAGQLVMVWRQRVRPGKVKGNWTGPLRLVLMVADLRSHSHPGEGEPDTPDVEA